jgi:hypothetical protein
MDTHRFTLSRDAIGYPDGVWEHPFGAVYCGGATEADCDPETVETGIDAQCVEFTGEFPAPDRTIVSVGAIGDWHFLTWPGEPGTELIQDLLAAVREQDGVSDVMLFGYAQDYTGYSLHEDDWWQGGYEASGALWGPLQGEYISARALDAFARSLSAWDPYRPLEPRPLAPFAAGDYTPYVPTPAQNVGLVGVQVDPAYGPTDVVAFAVAGLDPWLGTPVAWLEQDGAVVSRPNGMRLDSDGYGWWLDLEPFPTYASDMDATSRVFWWTFHLPVTHTAPGWPDLLGTYTIVVELPDGSQARSASFTVSI